MRLVIYAGFFLAVIPSVFALSPGSQNQPIVPPIFAITPTGAVDTWKVEGTMSPSMSYTVYVGSQHGAATRVKCSEALKADANGHFVCTFKSQPKETFVELRDGDGETQLAQSVFPQHDSAAASPASGGTTTFFVDVNMNYCDRSLPYLFAQKDSPKPKLEIMTSSTTWQAWLKSRMTDGLGQTPTVDVAWDADVLPKNWEERYSNVNDPIGPDAVVADAGGPILGDPSNELSTNTADAQRLLIRTLFGPNAFHLACQYQYLTGEPPVSGDTTGTLANADGTKESGLTNGIGKPFDLAAVDAPHYYLIDIVRWTDAPAAKSSSAPLYQVASDNWYLLNYSNKLDANRDFTTLGRFKPQMVQKVDGASQALNIVGDQNVLFLAIHLAPQPMQPKTATTSDSKSNVSYPPFNGFQISPTERAWYSTKIRYTMKATRVQPLNVQDLSTLIQTLLGFTPPLSKSSTSVVLGQVTENFAQPSTPELSLEDQITNLLGSFNLSQIDLILRGKRADCGQIASNLLNAIKDTKSITVDSAKGLVDNVENECGVTIKLPENGKPEEIQSAIISGLQAGVPSKQPIYSLYQGQYGAALVTNMSNLPVDLSSTWTATFSPASATVTVASHAYALSSPIKSAAPSKSLGKISKAKDAGAGSGSPSPGSPSDWVSQQVNGAGSSAICDATSDSSDDAQDTQKPCTSPSATIVHNEKLSHWDISVAAPLPGYQDLTYEAGTTSTGAGTITAKTITRTNAYAMFDWFPFGQDLNTPPAIGIPHLAGGLPLAGKTFNKPYFAVAETFRIPKIPLLGASVSVRPMFGWVWNKEFHTIAATSSTPSSEIPYRALKPQFAIEVSIKSVASAISKSTSK